MRAMATAWLVLGLALFGVATLAADKGGDKNLKGEKSALPGLSLPKGLELTADQQSKFDAISGGLTGKLSELRKQYEAILTPERRKAQAEAMQQAKADGKDKQAVVEAGQAALKLTADESAKLKQLGAEHGSLIQGAHEKLLALLTDEQRKKLGKGSLGKGSPPDKGSPDKGGGKGTVVLKGVPELPKAVELSADQQAKLKAIREELAGKLADVQKQYNAILTPERQRAQAEAMQKAKADGKDKQGIHDAGQAALALKDGEADKLKSLKGQHGELMKDAHTKLLSLLTEDQKAKLKPSKNGK